MNDTAQETTAVMTLLVEHEHVITPVEGKLLKSQPEWVVPLLKMYTQWFKLQSCTA